MRKYLNVANGRSRWPGGGVSVLSARRQNSFCLQKPGIVIYTFMCVNINKRFQGKEKCQQVKLRAGRPKKITLIIWENTNNIRVWVRLCVCRKTSNFIYYVFNCNGQRHWQNEGGIRGVCVISDAQPAHKSHNCGCLRPF